MAHHPLGRDHLPSGQVVGHVEEATDEDPVAGDSLLLDRVAPTVGRQLLGHEATLGADRHDHRILHLLGLGEAQHLGAEVLASVRPADAAAGDGAAAQVHAFHPRGVDEDLVLRPRLGQLGDPVRVELERDVRLRRSVGAALEVVRTERRPDDADVAAQDPVLVEVRHLVERRLDADHDLQGRIELLHGRALRILRTRHGAHLALPVGVEPHQEQLHQHRGDAGIGGERALHVGLAERDAGLAQILAVRTQDDDLAPSDPGPQHQAVEAVVLDLSRPDAGERFAELLVDAVGVEVGTLARGASRNRAARPRGAPARLISLGCSSSTFRPMFSSMGSASESTTGAPARALNSLNRSRSSSASSGR